MTSTAAATPARSSIAQTSARVVLGLFLGFAGIGHFVSKDSFSAQVPPWMPFTDAVIYISGVIELAFAIGLLFAPSRLRIKVGWVLAAFFVAIFPGNLSQYFTHTDAFGLDTDTRRLIRLAFQPVLVVWALWCTGAWASRRST